MAWLISDREDSATLECFLKAVKLRSPSTVINTANHVLVRNSSPWLCRSWRKNLHRLVKDPNRKTDIYQVLHILLNENSQTEFKKLLENFLHHYKPMEAAFIQYFENFYSTRTGKSILHVWYIYCNTLYAQRSGLCVSGSLIIQTLIQICTLKGLALY